MKKTLFILVISLLLALTFVALFYRGYLRFNYPSENEYPIKGIDISHHQGQIDWKKLREEHLSFVFIKATEGGDFKDKFFQDNWQNSKNEGYLTGAYHFYRLCKSPEEQASNFIESVPKDSTMLAPTVDLEFGGNCKTDKSDSVVIKEITDFLMILENHYHKKPIIYVTSEFYDRFLTTKFKEYPIWFRNIYSTPHLKDRQWQIWQYANRGRLKGINSYVDLNVWHAKRLEEIQ